MKKKNKIRNKSKQIKEKKIKKIKKTIKKTLTSNNPIIIQSFKIIPPPSKMGSFHELQKRLFETRFPNVIKM